MERSTSLSSPMYTTSEVQDILRVTQRTLYNYIRRGQLQAFKLGRDWRITEDSLQQFLKERSSI